MANIILGFFVALINELNKVRFCTWVSFKSVTVPTMNKTGNPLFGRVQKVTTASKVLFNSRYVKFADGEPVPTDEQGREKLPWGMWRVYPKLIDHKGKVYVRLYFLPNSNVKVSYLVDGRKATEEELAIIKSFVRSNSHDEWADGRIKTPRTYDVTGITEFRVNGTCLNASDYQPSNVG